MSAKANVAAEILKRLGVEFQSYDVLSDPALREGIKQFSNWPTIPQLYVDGEFVVDTGHVVAWETSLDYAIGKAASGWVASFFSGEGFVCEFRGRGRLYMQSRNPEEYGSTVGALLPPREDS